MTSSTAPPSLYSTSPPAQTTVFHSSRPSLDGAAASTHSAGVALDHISYLLLRGEKKEAVRFAVDEKLWSHALVISSCLDKQTWADVVKAFTAAELGAYAACAPQGRSRQALRLTYEMLSGAPGSGRLAWFCVEPTPESVTEKPYALQQVQARYPISPLARSDGRLWTSLMTGERQLPCCLPIAALATERRSLRSVTRSSVPVGCTPVTLGVSPYS